MRRSLLVLLTFGSVLTAGCDALGIESGTATAARKEAEGKAIGSACRHALRAIEDCYTLYPKASKAAVYAGWLEMDGYMRENKLEGIVPVVPRKSAQPAPAAASSVDAEGGSGHGTSDAEGADKGKADADHGKGESGAPSRRPTSGH